MAPLSQNASIQGGSGPAFVTVGPDSDCATLEAALAMVANHGTILLGHGRFLGAVIDKPVTLLGRGAKETFLSGGPGAAVLTVSADVALQGITIEALAGSAVTVTSGTLTAEGCDFRACGELPVEHVLHFDQGSNGAHVVGCKFDGHAKRGIRVRAKAGKFLFDSIKIRARRVEAGCAFALAEVGCECILRSVDIEAYGHEGDLAETSRRGTGIRFLGAATVDGLNVRGFGVGVAIGGGAAQVRGPVLKNVAVDDCRGFGIYVYGTGWSSSPSFRDVRVACSRTAFYADEAASPDVVGACFVDCDTGIQFSGVSTGTFTNVRIERARLWGVRADGMSAPILIRAIIDGAATGMSFSGGATGLFIRCEVKNGSGHGLEVDGADTNPHVVSASIHHQDTGLAVSDRGKGLFVDCDFYANGEGVRVSGGGSPHLVKARIHENETMGVSVSHYGGEGHFDGCDIFGNDFGVFVGDGGNPSFVRCAIRDNESNQILADKAAARFFVLCSEGMAVTADLDGKTTGSPNA